MANLLSTVFSSPTLVFTAAFLLRAVLLVYGLWQDANSPVKYTDIDYLVFTDAARFTFPSSSSSSPPSSFLSGLVPRGSPYDRETYRYTPLLAYLLWPTTPAAAASLPGPRALWASWGKVLFAAADLAAGYLLVAVLRRHRGLARPRALRYAGAIWLLNPMVAAISTRGSSEGLLGVLVAALLWAVLERRVVLAGLLLGLGVHFKIYPFVYAPAIVWWMDAERMAGSSSNNSSRDTTISPLARLQRFRVVLTLVSLATFAALNLAMYALYGHDFLQHTFLHHVTRIDHRHNFSPYNVLLYLASAAAGDSGAGGFRIESVAFVPQLLLSVVLIPLVGAKKDLAATMLAQTFAFVTFNKVCTSQYFLWYMVFLPLYLPDSSLTRRPRLGLAALGLWVAAQAAWLQQGFNLEFLGRSTFAPGLWLASLAFFLVNCWILGLIINDMGTTTTIATPTTISGGSTSKIGGGGVKGVAAAPSPSSSMLSSAGGSGSKRSN
ncbi:glycosyltransferase family 50 protein [Apiospora kogelbergensis]|uniref:glycosyltransferase family 50 protein n=1 Tax=Apiospora kogelbergensis TaxID=1337665 RepID=UPI00312CCE96